MASVSLRYVNDSIYRVRVTDDVVTHALADGPRRIICIERLSRWDRLQHLAQALFAKLFW